VCRDSTCGIFSGIKSYGNSNEVVEALGEKVIQALGAAIPRTRRIEFQHDDEREAEADAK